ncbi:MAG: hypothetical protein D3910_11505 [Candidatus Electrothrix sp. ATG2]|nr:hypothetical protein [Candidatus Electrothrix sp. ATG2]
MCCHVFCSIKNMIKRRILANRPSSTAGIQLLYTAFFGVYIKHMLSARTMSQQTHFVGQNARKHPSQAGEEGNSVRKERRSQKKKMKKKTATAAKERYITGNEAFLYCTEGYTDFVARAMRRQTHFSGQNAWKAGSLQKSIPVHLGVCIISVSTQRTCDYKIILDFILYPSRIQVIISGVTGTFIETFSELSLY